MNARQPCALLFEFIDKARMAAFQMRLEIIDGPFGLLKDADVV